MKLFKKMSVKAKLWLLVGLFSLGVASYSVVSIRVMNAVKVNGPLYLDIVQGKDLVADILPPPEYIIESYLIVLQTVEALEMGQERPKIDALIERGKVLKAEYAQRHEFWVKDLPEGKMKETMVAKSYAPAAAFYDIRDKEFLPAVLSGNLDKAKAIARGEIKSNYEAHRAAIDEVVQMATKKVQENEQRGVELVSWGLWTSLALAGGILVIVGALCSFIAQAITKPLNRTVEVLKDIAQGEGDLTRRLTSTGADEIGQLGYWFNAFAEKIHDMVRTIGHNTQQLASSSEELSTVSQQMAGNAEETSAQSRVVSSAARHVENNIQTVAAATEEMNASIKEIAKNAGEAARVAGNAVQVAEKTNATVSKLGDSSSQIGDVVKVINSIAEQTNLLALNATIEAARAGEAGKGFAVVANEVKELAKQTGKATGEISQMIESIQTSSQDAVEAIGQITGIISQVNDIANTIASAVEEQSATTNEMSRNVSDAVKGATDITQNIGGVAEAAQSAESGADDTQRAAQELARMAGDLQQIVGQFKYDESDHALGEMKASVRPMPKNAPAKAPRSKSRDRSQASTGAGQDGGGAYAEL